MTHRVALVLQFQQQFRGQGETISESKVIHGNPVFFQFACVETRQPKEVKPLVVIHGLELVPMGVVPQGRMEFLPVRMARAVPGEGKN